MLIPLYQLLLQTSCCVCFQTLAFKIFITFKKTKQMFNVIFSLFTNLPFWVPKLQQDLYAQTYHHT